MIFKGKDLNTRWFPVDIPPGWLFSSSNKGWTSDSHFYEWISTVFEPNTRPPSESIYRALILDRYISYLRANIIGFCLKHNICLIRLPAHSSHALQPLDISCFSPLKRYLSSEVSQLPEGISTSI